ncbi:AMP-binding protein [Streptomyces sp. NPDC004749]
MTPRSTLTHPVHPVGSATATTRTAPESAERPVPVPEPAPGPAPVRTEHPAPVRVGLPAPAPVPAEALVPGPVPAEPPLSLPAPGEPPLPRTAAERPAPRRGHAATAAHRPGNLAADLAGLAERHGWTARAAFYQDHQVWTHGEVHDLAARAATVLADHGVRPGDRVLLALPDSPAWAVAFLAIARLGAVAVLVNPELPAADRAFMADDSEAAVCVTGPGAEDRFGPDRRLYADQLLALARTAAPAEPCPAASDTPLYIQYTSGTTGRPKGVVHCHGDPEAYYEFVGRRLLRIGPDDVTLSVSKLYFAYGFGNAFVFPLFSGSAAVLAARRPGPAAVDELVARHRVTLLYSVPSAYAALLADRAVGHAACFASVRAAVSAGERMPAGLGERVTELLGAPVLEQIGSTEVGHAFCANSLAHNTPGTVGRPVPGYEVELRDDAGRPVAPGGTGELWVRGPSLTPGYLNLPEETARALSGGWLATRDRARREPDGTYRHLGRADDMEMVGGITVAPQEVETVLGAHPAVREVAVAAVADDRGVTGLRAYVVMSASAEPSASADPSGAVDATERAAQADQRAAQAGQGMRTDHGRQRAEPGRPEATADGLEEALLSLARRHLAAFKVPRTVRVVTSLPRTATGKLRRHLLRQGSW